MRTPGIYENIPNNEYHSDKEWLSSSQIKVALSSAHAFKYFVLDGKGKRKSSDSKDFGSIVHKLVLEEKDFFNEYHVATTKDLDARKKVDKEKLEEIKALAGSRIIIDQEDFDEACICRDSVMAHTDARKYLEMPGVSEASIYQEIDHTLPSGEIITFKVRVRPDRLVYGTAILDLKTTKGPAKEQFERDAFAPWGYHYDLSAALYVRAEAKRTGEVLPFIFIAVGNDHPYATAVYKVKEDTMRKGEAKLNRALNTIIMAERAGVWEFQKEMEEI